VRGSNCFAWRTFAEIGKRRERRQTKSSPVSSGQRRNGRPSNSAYSRDERHAICRVPTHGFGAGGREHIATALPSVAQFHPVNPLRDSGSGGNEYYSNHDRSPSECPNPAHDQLRFAEQNHALGLLRPNVASSVIVFQGRFLPPESTQTHLLEVPVLAALLPSRRLSARSATSQRSREGGPAPKAREAVPFRRLWGHDPHSTHQTSSRSRRRADACSGPSSQLLKSPLLCVMFPLWNDHSFPGLLG
jgi:hypothetical protein